MSQCKLRRQASSWRQSIPLYSSIPNHMRSSRLSSPSDTLQGQVEQSFQAGEIGKHLATAKAAHCRASAQWTDHSQLMMHIQDECDQRVWLSHCQMTAWTICAGGEDQQAAGSGECSPLHSLCSVGCPITAHDLYAR